jgi:hypothetical protein
MTAAGKSSGPTGGKSEEKKSKAEVERVEG